MIKTFTSLLLLLFLFGTSSSLEAQDITGFAWVDENGNGINDAGEPTISGMAVDLLASPGGAVVLSAITDGGGMYTFSGMAPGAYNVRFNYGAFDPTLRVTTPNNGADTEDSDVLQSNGTTTAAFNYTGVAISNIDAGFYVTVNIDGEVWLDNNGNGNEDDGSLPLTGAVSVLLERDNNGTWVTATQYNTTPIVGGNAQNVTGNFSFSNLAPGNYRLAFGTSGMLYYTFTDFDGGGTQATDGGSDSDADRTSGLTYEITLSSGDGTFSNAEAGYFNPVSVEGIVWHDLDGNAQDNEGGAALPIATDIYLEYNDPVSGWGDATTTYTGAALANPINTANVYDFNNLVPGEYRIRFEEPTDYYLTAQDVGAEATDSDPNPLDGLTTSYTLASGATQNNVDAGMYTDGMIEGYVWEDVDGNGIDNDGMGALTTSVDVLLQIESPPNSGTYIDASLQIDGGALTNPINTTGTYSFANLSPGRYRVLFEEPGNTTISEYHLTTQNATGDGGADIADANNDSDPNPTANGAGYGVSHNILLTSNRTAANINGGYFKPAVVGNLIWHDEDADGIFLGTENLPVPAGITVRAINSVTNATATDISNNPAIANVGLAGDYIFENATALKPGSYIFEVNLPAGWLLSDVDETADTDDSDFDPTTRRFGPVVIESSSDTRDIDGGIWRNITVGGIVWGETTGDCINNNIPAEPGFANINLDIVDAGGVTVISTITNGTGMYSFMVRPGDYTIVIGGANFANGAPLDNLGPCSPAVDPNADIPNDNTGVDDGSGGVVTTGGIRLRCGREPENNGLTNNTIDFGFVSNCGGPDTNDDAYLSCDEARILPECDVLEYITGACITMPVSNSNGPSPLCPGSNGTGPQNILWFGFIGGEGTYSIDFELFGCIPGGTGVAAVQAGVYAVEADGPCPGTVAPWCNDGQNTGSISIPSTSLVPGQLYVMFFDGWNGTICSYEVDVNGNYGQYDLPPPAEIVNTTDNTTAPVTVCPGATIDFLVNDALTTYEDLRSLTYHWSLQDCAGNVLGSYLVDGDPAFETLDNEFSYTFSNIGCFKVCIDEVVHSCETEVVSSICYEVNVVLKTGEDFGQIGLCDNELGPYTGPTSVDDLGVTTDPNNDGTDGWQIPGFDFVVGTNTGIVTDDQGCMYEQTVDVYQLPDSDVEFYATAICGEDNFPLTILDEQFFIPTYDLNVIGEGLAENGCDSLMNVTVQNLEIEGFIDFVGCQNGFILEFTETERSFNALDDIDVTYTWTSSSGGLPQFGAPNRVRVTGPGTYYLTIELTTNFNGQIVNVTCPYAFDYELILNNLAPETPTGDNWDNQFCSNDVIKSFTIDTDEDLNDVDITWTFPAGVTVVSGQGTTTITLNFGSTTGGQVCAFLSNDCASSPLYCEAVVITPVPVAAVAVTAVDVCIDSITTSTLTSAVVAGATYSWNFDGGNPIGNTNVPGPINVSWSSAGVKVVTLSMDNLGCISNTDSIEVNVSEPLDPPALSCTSSIDNIVFTWGNISGQSGYTPSILTGQPAGNGVYNPSNLTYTVGGLAVGEEVTITLNTMSSGPCSIAPVSLTCKAQNCPAKTVSSIALDTCWDATTLPFLLTANVTPTSSGTYEWTGPGIIDNVTGLFNPATANNGSNSVNIKFIDDVGCEYTSNVSILTNMIPTSTFVADEAIICQDSTVMIDYTGTALTSGTFTWTAGDIIGTINGRGPHTVQWSTPGNKVIMLSVERAGCTSSETTIPVRVEPRIDPINITCDTKETSIGFTWNAPSNVSNYTITVTNVRTGAMQTLTQSTPNYNATGLLPQDSVIITVQANSSNSCPGTIETAVCKAENCPPFVIDLPADTTLCLKANAPTILLSANVSGGPGLPGVGKWRGPGVDSLTGVFNPNTAGISSVAGHIIRYQYQEASCKGESTMKIFVISQPKSDFTGLTNICVDDSLQLNYTGGSPSTLPFAWTAESTTVVKKNNTQYAAKWSQAGDYLVRLQVGNSDCISDPDSIRVKVDPKMEPVTINCDPTLNSITFTWNDINCATDYELRINNTVISTNSNLSYTRNGLNEGDQVTITVTPQEDCACPAIPTTKTCEARACPPIVLALATPNREFCQGVISNTFQLTAQAQGSQSAGTGTWSGTGVNATGAFNPAGLNSGNYKVKYTYEETGCTFIDSLTITIHPNPTVSATAVDPDCFLENVGSAIVLPTGGTGTNYSLTVNNVASPSLALNGLAPGVYNVEITDSKGCKATNNFNIMNAIEAQLQINGNTLIKAGTQSTLALATTSLTDPLDSIVWTNSAGTVICSGPNCTEVTINPEADDTYCASIFYNDECTKEECIDIKVFKTTIITMPNIIRPGSATNGSFFVTNYENIQSVDEMLIFDRWGQKVFAIENVAPGATSGWDGTYNNQDVVPGVYVYMIELTLTDGSKDKLIGDVTVIGK